MQDTKSIIYSRSVLEFTTVAKEYCELLSHIDNLNRKQFLSTLQKLLPLLYLKGSLLPHFEWDEDLPSIGDQVKEEEYNWLFSQIRRMLGPDDEYLEVFDDDMQRSETPVVNSIAERSCDIFQDIMNYLLAFRCGVEEVMGSALWELQSEFAHGWGKHCTTLLRAVHCVITNAGEEISADETDEDDTL